MKKKMYLPSSFNPVKSVTQVHTPVAQQTISIPVVQQNIPITNYKSQNSVNSSFTDHNMSQNSDNNSEKLIGEIKLLKHSLQQKDIELNQLKQIEFTKTSELKQKDLIIESLRTKEHELITKLAINESNNLSLSREYNELKQDKIDLRTDKVRLSEEVTNLKQSELLKEEKLRQKELELEKIKKDFADLILEEPSFIHEQQNNEPYNPLLIDNTVQSILFSEESSIVLSNNIHNNVSNVLSDHQNILLMGQSMQSLDFSLLE